MAASRPTYLSATSSSGEAPVATLAEMYVQGVSTRKVKAVTEELCGHAFSASAVSAINKRLDETLSAFATRLFPSPLPTSSSMLAMRRCARAAWS